MYFNKPKNNKGFTLIEMMVAVSIFAIVALIVSGTFVILAQSYRQIQINRTITDNLNFALDSLTLQLRYGGEYTVLGDSISFEEYRINEEGRYAFRKIGYSYDGENKTIKQCTGDSLDNCVSFISPEIEVDSLNFTQEGNLITVNISGNIPNLRSVSSDFNVSTKVLIRN